MILLGTLIIVPISADVFAVAMWTPVYDNTCDHDEALSCSWVCVWRQPAYWFEPHQSICNTTQLRARIDGELAGNTAPKEVDSDALAVALADENERAGMLKSMAAQIDGLLNTPDPLRLTPLSKSILDRIVLSISKYVNMFISRNGVP